MLNHGRCPARVMPTPWAQSSCSPAALLDVVSGKGDHGMSPDLVPMILRMSNHFLCICPGVLDVGLHAARPRRSRPVWRGRHAETELVRKMTPAGFCCIIP